MTHSLLPHCFPWVIVCPHSHVDSRIPPRKPWWEDLEGLALCPDAGVGVDVDGYALLIIIL